MAWDNDSDYKYTFDHDIVDWGWEFIRRNDAYIAEWKDALSEFKHKEASGELCKTIRLNPKPHQIDSDRKFHQEMYYNFIDSRKNESYLIKAPKDNPWKLKYYQDPRSKNLIDLNRPSRTPFCFPNQYQSSIKLEVKPDDLVMIVNLNAPLADQFNCLKEYACKLQKKHLNRNLKQKRLPRKVWLQYLRLLDACLENVKKKNGIKKMFRDSLYPEQEWDEKLKQAKRMVSEGFRDLMV